MRYRFMPAVVGVFALLVVVAGCDSNTSGSPTGYNAMPTAAVAPMAGVTPPPTSTSATVSSNGASSTSVSLGSSSGVTAQITIPAAVSGSGSVTISGSTAAPNSVSALTLPHTQSSPAPSPSPIGYLEISPSATAAFGSMPSFSVALPLSISTSGQAFYIAFYTNDPNFTSAGAFDQWAAPVLGPATVSGQTLTFNPATGNAVTLSPNDYYVFGLYGIQPSPSPSPSPSASGSTSPSPSASASPTSSST